MTRHQKGLARIYNWQISLSADEFEIVEGRYRRSICRSRAEYGRQILLHKPVINRYRNQSLDDYLSVATGLKSILDDSSRQLHDALALIQTGTTDGDSKKIADCLAARQVDIQQQVAELLHIMIKIHELCLAAQRPL